MSEPSQRFTLNDLPLAGRITLAAFLISVGFGYFSALVQLHVQQASPGQVLPGANEVIDTYHGKKDMGTLERLIVANENLPFTGSGSMRAAFTTKSVDFNDTAFDRHAEEKFKASLPKDASDEDKQAKWEKLTEAEIEKLRAEAKPEVRKEREGEAAALVAWIHAGLDKESYENDNFTLPDSMRTMPLTEKFQVKDDKGVVTGAKIRGILKSRCVRCHQTGREVPDAPLTDFKHLVMYTKQKGEGGIPLRKLAQSTHVHLLGFSMLYGLTGFIFACSSWPGFLRISVAPLALIAQVVDISFWWLARLDAPYGPEFAKCIRISGGVVAAALGLQIILSLFSMFGWFGRFVLLVLILATLAGGYFLNDLVIGPYLAAQANLVAQ